MTRHWIGIALLAACLSCSSTGGPRYMGFAVGTSYAPYPPRIYLDHSPRMMLVGGVYVADDPYLDYDMFQYGSRWYLYANDYWYTSSRYDGPYRAVDVRYVPHEVIAVPAGEWRDHPRGRGYARGHRTADRDHGRYDNPGRGRGRGHGHDRGDDDDR